MNNTKLYCCYHNEQQKIDFKNDNLIWIYGPNDPLNKYISEMSLYKWIFENDKTSDIIGVCHYRRQLYLKDIDYNFINDNRCIVYEYAYFRNNDYHLGIREWSRPQWFNCRFIYFDWIEYLRNNNLLHYYEADEFSADQGIFITKCICIMNRNHFMNMCKYIFGFLDFIDCKYLLNKNPNNYEAFVNNWRNNYVNNNYLAGTTVTNEPFNINYDMRIRLLSYLCEWLVSNYIVANFTFDNIKKIN